MWTWKHLFLYGYVITMDSVNTYVWHYDKLIGGVSIAFTVFIFYELINKWFTIKEKTNGQ